MPTPTEFAFTHQELLELLVRHAGVTEGIWGLNIRFNWTATNVGPSDDDLRPAAVVMIASIGLAKADKLHSLSVDASKVATRAVKAEAKPKRG